MWSMPWVSIRPTRSGAAVAATPVGAGPARRAAGSAGGPAAGSVIVMVITSSGGAAGEGVIFWSRAQLLIGQVFNRMGGMTSTLDRKRVRKDPATRRAEIVAAAGAIALAEGLECVTLRRVADDLA